MGFGIWEQQCRVDPGPLWGSGSAALDPRPHYLTRTKVKDGRRSSPRDQKSHLNCGITPGRSRRGKEIKCLIAGDFNPRERGRRREATANGIQLMGGARGGVTQGKSSTGALGERAVCGTNHVIQHQLFPAK